MSINTKDTNEMKCNVKGTNVLMTFTFFFFEFFFVQWIETKTKFIHLYASLNTNAEKSKKRMLQ